MAATLTQERFTGAEWLFERKFDGIRLIAYKKGRDVRLYSRNRLLQNDAYPAVVAAIAALPVRQAILDGEATGVWGSAADASPTTSSTSSFATDGSSRLGRSKSDGTF